MICSFTTRWVPLLTQKSRVWGRVLLVTTETTSRLSLLLGRDAGERVLIRWLTSLCRVTDSLVTTGVNLFNCKEETPLRFLLHSYSNSLLITTIDTFHESRSMCFGHLSSKGRLYEYACVCVYRSSDTFIKTDTKTIYID